MKLSTATGGAPFGPGGWGQGVGAALFAGRHYRAYVQPVSCPSVIISYVVIILGFI